MKSRTIFSGLTFLARQQSYALLHNKYAVMERQIFLKNHMYITYSIHTQGRSLYPIHHYTLRRFAEANLVDDCLRGRIEIEQNLILSRVYI